MITNKTLKVMVACVLACAEAHAQFPTENYSEDVIRTTHFPKLKQLEMTEIPGAPILSQPQRIDGKQQEIRVGKHGLCYPALYDWNGDGKLDLLLGEFSTGDKENNVKVFLNEGSKKKMKFSGKYFYANDDEGNLITNHQWCCIGIHPRFVDLDNDGKLDMLSGQYNPGQISWWRGTDKGLAPRQFVDQEGYTGQKHYTGLDPDSPKSNEYWNYTSTGFADYNGDGLLDLFVGGTAGMRVALNEGTAEHPKFGIRKPLLFVDGTRLSSYPSDTHRGITKTYMTPIDWDGDGVLDILATDDYSVKGCNAITFFKGVKTNLGLRFEKGVPLFTMADGSKELPGCQPQIAVADVNGDGVNDIVFGLSVPTINGYEATDSIAWQWIGDLGIEMPGKDAGEYYMWTSLDSLKARIRDNENDRRYFLGKLTDEKYLTLRHRGYVFVMYGKKNPVPASASQVLTVDPPVEVKTEKFEASCPVSYDIEGKLADSVGEIDVVLDIQDGWHGYAEQADFTKQEYIPTKVEIELPKTLLMQCGRNQAEAPYTGSGLYFGRQVFKCYFFCVSPEGRKLLNDRKIPVKVKISYQVCNDQMCLPPEEHVVEKTIELK